MDIATLVGIILAFSLVIMAMALAGSLGWFVSIPSVLIVFGGTMGVILINFSLSQVTSVMGVVKKSFFHKSEDPTEVINRLVDFATRARRDGILALETAAEEVDDEFLREGIKLAVDGTDPELVNAIMETKLQYIAQRHQSGMGILNSIGMFAPSMGMIGTLIGLVAMLQTMDDPSTIGPAMAIALLTTLYGSMIANMFALPVAGKLAERSQEELLVKEIVIMGIMSIQAGDNPRIVEQKLNAFLPPSQRKTQFDS
ncbi:MotA/TolQ/ExbB proton channel family protein [Desulfurispirillum indicum]|uniref:MotA/TolQ/ExbB proton channel n=1 Tax=Desulfurispirillum indicum (strain ATCC BAA-1389 / DSM 22839 / S5) TaxID=653733 RepID=E6W674_DESIS|nr:MotA/TolQ/ExbB proton channel family protein [Desulfurispirillum indicum]ADU66110.1 MotA/TolQ/ExbB proton channel [Desulfurispirillum indicum S5]UCZ55516.1 MotA/TolQ/ExbB proton channel family protein [Desulfurispirillum indicum]